MEVVGHQCILSLTYPDLSIKKGELRGKRCDVLINNLIFKPGLMSLS